jgi:hypothetical protein
MIRWRTPRDGAIIFRELVGKLTVLRIECEKCGRSGQYRLDCLIMRYGIDAKRRRRLPHSSVGIRAGQKYGAFGPRFVSNERVELRGRRKYNPVIRKTGDPSVPVDADDGGRILRITGAPPVAAFVYWERESGRLSASARLRGRRRRSSRIERNSK